MGKIAIISDTHWGVRNDNVAFMDMTKKFLDDIFFPELRKNNISTIVHLGDLVDRRKQISYLTANRLRKDFLDKLGPYQTHIIAGNHDCYYKNTNRINALSELVEGNYLNIECYIEPEEVELHGRQTLFLPWICDENEKQSMELINASKANFCMGHLEILGFEMFRGSVATHGHNRTVFDKFGTVLSGHFHHRSTDGSITYVGSHGEFTWSDYDDPRGFHILNLDNHELEFIQNPYKLFRKIWYDDTEKTMDEVLNVPFENFAGSMVKIIVTNKTNPYWFDMFCERLDKVGLLNMQIVEDHLNLNLEDDTDIVNEAESTLDIFKKHIGQLTTIPNLNTPKLESVITDLYNKAQHVE